MPFKLNVHWLKMAQIEGGKAESIVEGRAEGERQAKLETTRKLRVMGMPDETILNTTGLSLKDLKDL